MLNNNFNLINLESFSLKFKLGKAKSEVKAGSVNFSGNLSAGNGGQSEGGNANVVGGDGFNGASGGDVNVGPGIYKAGDGGNGGKGGNLNIRGGDAKQ